MSDQGMMSTWPTRMSLGSAMSLASVMASTVVPNRAAMPLSVSPDCTLYVRPTEGLGEAGVPGVGPLVAEGAGDPSGAAEGALVAVAPGDGVGEEPVDGLAEIMDDGTEETGGACAGAVVRAITSTRNASAIRPTRRA